MADTPGVSHFLPLSTVAIQVSIVGHIFPMPPVFTRRTLTVSMTVVEICLKVFLMYCATSSLSEAMLMDCLLKTLFPIILSGFPYNNYKLLQDNQGLYISCANICNKEKEVRFIMNKMEIYERAVQSIVDYSSGDITSCLMKEYAIKGMYNLLSCLDNLGIVGKETKLIALPDFTFSRNDKRYNSFFPYGSIIHIDTSGEMFIPLGFRPNCCGITMLELTKTDANIDKIKTNLHTLTKLDLGIAIDDLNRGNHFIGIYENRFTSQMYAIIHGSFNFVKSGHNDIPGLYIDKTNYWDDKLCVYSEKDVYFPYLISDNASQYYKSYLQHEQKTKELRSQIAYHLFPNSKVIFNETHEGFYQHNIITLGAYIKSSPFSAPIMLSAESDLSIIDVSRPLTDVSSNIYACPHGGGYSLKYIVDGLYNIDTNIYKLQFENKAVMETTDIRKLIYDYRTNTDLIWCENHTFGNITNKFATLYNFKL